MKHLCHYICLISYINILKSYDYLVSSFIHCYLLSVVFNNKIHAPVSFKIVKQEYGLKNVYSKVAVHNTPLQIHENMEWSTCLFISPF